jgi:crotonobetaine/carnitine-CoA ligase
MMYTGLHEPLRWVLPDVLTEMAHRQPAAQWIIATDGETMNFGQAESQARRAASFFAALGVRRGQRVGIFMSNGCDLVRAWMGVGKLGATAVFLNTELRRDFLKHQLNNSEITYLVADAALLPVLDEVIGDLPRLKTVITVGGFKWAPPPGSRVFAWSDFQAAPEWDGEGPGASDTACVMYTSGTSGPSKGVLMPHAHCTLYGIGAIKCLQLQPADRYYVSLPLFHANGLFMQLGATLLAGLPAIVRPRFSATNWLADIQEHGATVTNLLGSTAAFVIGQPPTDQDSRHALRAVLSAPNLPQHEEAFRTRFAVRDVVSGFGMTEVNIPIWGRIGCSAPGAAGWVHDEHFEVCIADAETDLPLPRGHMGEILVRPRVPFGFMAGYYNLPEKTVEAWRNLWFHTGDAGTMDEAGLVTFVDRIKDCIRRRGENISATEVEAVVLGLPGVAEAAAYAVASDIPGGEDEVMLALVAETGSSISCEAVVFAANERLPRFARPRYVRVMDELPKTATGKIQRAVLRRQGKSDAVDMLAGGASVPLD